jgi:putative ABC transport system ATP-binding protein
MPSQLSGGQKQRVAIARSLMNNPDIILADEPVGNLDSESAQNVLDILKELNDVDKKTVIMVTHNPDHLVYADRVIHMKDGRVIKEQVFREKRAVIKEKKMEDFLKDEDPENSELKILMNSFKNLLPQQVDMLLIPFKAKQLLAHLLSDHSDEQVSMAEAFLKELLFKNIDIPIFSSRLDLELDQGGAGWNKLRALKFSKRVESILAMTQALSGTSDEGTLKLASYLEQEFGLKLSDATRLRLQAALKMRLESTIGQIELSRKLDKSFIQGGVGLRRDTVDKMTREVEMIMLLKYS